MNCPYCQREMEDGYVLAYATGSMPIAMIDWYSNEKTQTGFFGRPKKEHKSVIDINGKRNKAFYCESCKLVFPEFKVK